jgi:hypothetical protein
MHSFFAFFELYQWPLLDAGLGAVMPHTDIEKVV